MQESPKILRDTITGDPVAVVTGGSTYSLETVITCPTVLSREDLRKFLASVELPKLCLKEMIKALYEHVEMLEAQYEREDSERRTHK